MRTFPRRTVTLVAALFLAAVCGTAQSTADERDIRNIGTQVQDSWNKGDAKMLAALWLTDGDYVSSTGRTASGRVEVEKAFAEQWSGVYRGTKIAHTLTAIHFIRRDVAIADGAFEINGMKDASGKVLGTRSGLTTIVT